MFFFLVVSFFLRLCLSLSFQSVFEYLFHPPFPHEHKIPTPFLILPSWFPRPFHQRKSISDWKFTPKFIFFAGAKTDRIQKKRSYRLSARPCCLSVYHYIRQSVRPSVRSSVCFKEVYNNNHDSRCNDMGIGREKELSCL